MADVELGDLRNRSDGLHILEREAMAGMGFKPVLGGERGGICNAAQFMRERFTLRVRIRPSVQLDDRCAQRNCRLDLHRVRLDEQADANPGFAQPGDHGFQMIMLARRVEPALGGALLAPLGDKADGMGTMAKGDPQHFLRCRHLHVEGQGNGADEVADILVDDMAAVLAKMRGDAVRPGVLRDQRRANRIGIGASARIANGRHMIDVDAKAQMTRPMCGPVDGHVQARLPGLTAGMAASSGGSASAS